MPGFFRLAATQIKSGNLSKQARPYSMRKIFPPPCLKKSAPLPILLAALEAECQQAFGARLDMTRQAGTRLA
jgi:hypothetical protein